MAVESRILCDARANRSPDGLLRYLEKAVLCQLVGVQPRGVLGLELLAPGEDEVGAAHRLLTKPHRPYRRLFDVLTLG